MLDDFQSADKPDKSQIVNHKSQIESSPNRHMVVTSLKLCGDDDFRHDVKQR